MYLKEFSLKSRASFLSNELLGEPPLVWIEAAAVEPICWGLVWSQPLAGCTQAEEVWGYPRGLCEEHSIIRCLCAEQHSKLRADTHSPCVTDSQSPPSRCLVQSQKTPPNALLHLSPHSKDQTTRDFVGFLLFLKWMNECRSLDR